MSTPTGTRWSRLDNELEDMVKRDYLGKWKPVDKTEPYWQKWVAQHIDRAKRNRKARKFVRSARNRQLRVMTLEAGAKAERDAAGVVAHEEEEEEEIEEPYGAEANDYDWSRGRDISLDLHYWHKWLRGLILRAKRNRDDGEKPTARRASDVGSEHHSMDYDIWMDERIQFNMVVRRPQSGFESDGEEGPSPSNKHDGWYSQSRNAAGAAGGN